jgi:hypothetical protein
VMASAFVLMPAVGLPGTLGTAGIANCGIAVCACFCRGAWTRGPDAGRRGARAGSDDERAPHAPAALDARCSPASRRSSTRSRGSACSRSCWARRRTASSSCSRRSSWASRWAASGCATASTRRATRCASSGSCSSRWAWRPPQRSPSTASPSTSWRGCSTR